MSPEEPDEALRWARESAISYTNPALSADIRQGLCDHDFGIAEKAHGYRAGQAAAEARIGELEEAIREALRRLNEYADMTADEWGDSVADGGIAAWMVIRAQMKAVVVSDLNRALLKGTNT